MSSRAQLPQAEDDSLHQLSPFVRWCGELRLPANYCRQEHYIFEHLLIYVLDGEAEYRVGRRHWHLAVGDLLFVPSGIVTEACTRTENPMHYRFIRFDFGFVGDYEQRPMNSREPGADTYALHAPPMPSRLRLPRKTNVSDDPRVGLLFERVVIETESKAVGYELFVRASLMEILGTIHRRCTKRLRPAERQNKHPKPIREAIEYMESRVGQKLSLTEVARVAHLSPQHFGRLFRQSTGVSPLRYLTCAKLRLAKAVLQRQEATVKEAAFTAGFEDQLYFTRVFRRIEGMTPSDYRRAVLSMDGAVTTQSDIADVHRLRGPYFTIAPVGLQDRR